MKKTKSLLITLAGYPYTPSSFLPDNGLANLAGCLREAGHETRILDYNTPECMDFLLPKEWLDSHRHLFTSLQAGDLATSEISGIHEGLRQLDQIQVSRFAKIADEVATIAQTEKVDWVGIKVWNGDGYIASCLISESLKKQIPHLPVIAGGPQVDWFRSYFLEASPYFDFAAYAEGEPMIVKFAEMIMGERTVAEVPNLYYREGNTIRQTPLLRLENLDSIPPACYEEEVYPSLYQNQKIRIGILEESRGCPVQCFFCEHPLKAGAILRKKSVPKIIKEIKAFAQSPGFRAYKFAGSFTPTKYLQQLAREFLKLPFPIEYVTYGHLKESGTDFNLLKKSGCYALFFGLESGSEFILDEKIRKGYEKKKAIETLKRCKEAGIFTITSIIYPSPGESQESTQITLELLKELRPDSVPCHFPFLLPHTRWFMEPERFGFAFAPPFENQQKYLSFFIKYKARLLFPPEYWPPLPYEIDGKNYARYSRETSNMTHALEKVGLLTLVSDEVALMGKYSGVSTRQFRDKYRKAVLSGEVEQIKELVQLINKNLQQI